MAFDPSSLLSVLTTGASASPMGAATGGVGLGLEVAGAVTSFMGAKKYQGQVQDYANTVNPLNTAKTQQDINIATQQQNIESANQNYMEMANQRQAMEQLRKGQQAGAQASAQDVSTNSIFGSGAKARQANITASTAKNEQALSGGLQTGRNIFGFNQGISTARIAQFGIENQISQANVGLQTAQAGYQTSEAMGKGLSSLGGGLMGASGSKLFS